MDNKHFMITDFWFWCLISDPDFWFWSWFLILISESDPDFWIWSWFLILISESDPDFWSWFLNLILISDYDLLISDFLWRCAARWSIFSRSGGPSWRTWSVTLILIIMLILNLISDSDIWLLKYWFLILVLISAVWFLISFEGVPAAGVFLHGAAGQADVPRLR